MTTTKSWNCPHCQHSMKRSTEYDFLANSDQVILLGGELPKIHCTRCYRSIDSMDVIEGKFDSIADVMAGVITFCLVIGGLALWYFYG